MVRGYENVANVTDKKFPGNPTSSYRTLYVGKIYGQTSVRNAEKGYFLLFHFSVIFKYPLK